MAISVRPVAEGDVLVIGRQRQIFFLPQNQFIIVPVEIEDKVPGGIDITHPFFVYLQFIRRRSVFIDHLLEHRLFLGEQAEFLLVAAVQPSDPGIVLGVPVRGANENYHEHGQDGPDEPPGDRETGHYLPRLIR
jgi:hypothetical protein